MSLRDTRRPPFTWVANDAMAVIRREVPATRQAGVRNAYLATAEAASARGDHEHREGDTIAEIARFACVTERRIREHLQELEYLGLIDVEKRKDGTGRDIASRYEIRDVPRSDNSSDQVGRSDAKTSDPTRARPTVVKEEKEEKPPLTPPQAGGDGDSFIEAPPENSRAHGTNPRAMVARAAEHEWRLRARAAVATLETPSDEHRSGFAHFLDALQPVTGSGTWLRDLCLAAVDHGVLVLDSQNLAFIGTRFNRAFEDAAERAGISVRMASPLEHEGLRDRAAAA